MTKLIFIFVKIRLDMDIVKNSFQVKSRSLKPHINDYWLIEFDSPLYPPQGVTLPPVGFPVLHFHYGSQESFYRYRSMPNRSIVIGQMDRHVRIYPSKGIKILGVNFKPYGFYNMFGISPTLFRNSAVDSKTIMKDYDIDKIISILGDGSMVSDASIGEIESILESYIKEGVKRSKHFEMIVDTIVEKRGLIHLSDFENENFSIRTLQRYFKEAIGISPKLFAQIYRHKYILEQMYLNRDIRWNDIVLNGYYYDFSHFTKDFSLFTNLKPRNYLTIKSDFASMILG